MLPVRVGTEHPLAGRMHIRIARSVKRIAQESARISSAEAAETKAKLVCFKSSSPFLINCVCNIMVVDDRSTDDYSTLLKYSGLSLLRVDNEKGFNFSILCNIGAYIAHKLDCSEIILWNNDYYEVNLVNENQDIVGKVPQYNYGGAYLDDFGASFSIICFANYVSPERLGITLSR